MFQSEPDTKKGNHQVNVMTNPLSETFESARMTALNLIKESNKRLMYFLDNPFIPASEKKRISEQVFENMIRIAHMEQKYQKESSPEKPQHSA